jgi:hypothetical protein
MFQALQLDSMQWFCLDGIMMQVGIYIGFYKINGAQVGVVQDLSILSQGKLGLIWHLSRVIQISDQSPLTDLIN